MSMKVTSLWRHPIKAHGREEVTEVNLIPGQTMPGDRLWAVAHQRARLNGGAWARCSNFTRAASVPSLMAITCKTEGHRLRLSHPIMADLVFDPNAEQAAFLKWISPLLRDTKFQATQLIEATEQGFTDSGWPSITLCNMATHRAVEDKLDHPLSIHRWRGNIWFEGAVAWEEFDWLGKSLRLGTAIIDVKKRTERCMATTANPESGARDADTLGALNSFGHQDFSVKFSVREGGRVAVGDRLEVL